MTTWGRATYAGIALGLASLWAEPALAAQCANVSFSPGSVTVPAWNPISPAAQQSTFTMTVTRLSTSTEAIRLMFLDSNNQSQPVRLGNIGPQSGPQYQVLNTSGENILYPQNSSVTSLRGQPAFSWQNKGSNNSQSATYRILVPANSSGADFTNGTYGETLNYAIQCLNKANFPNLTDGPTSGPAMSLTIPNLVSLTVASAATLNFQNFTSLSQQLNVGLKSTGPVNVAIDSTYKMKMIRSGTSAPYPDNSKIDYQMSLRGTNIESMPKTLTNQPRAGVSGSSWPLILSLPATPAGKVAGSYSDTITVILTPAS